MGTTYDPGNVGINYAHLDGGPENPGYFSRKDQEPDPLPESNIPYPKVDFSTDPELSYWRSDYNLIATLVPGEYTTGKTYNNLVVEVLLPVGMSFSKDDTVFHSRTLQDHLYHSKVTAFVLLCV